MEIKQFRYGHDGNLGYLIHSGGEAAAVDGGAADEIIGYISRNGLELKYVLNTHEHWDHVPGNERLLETSGAVNIKPPELARQGGFLLGGERVEVFASPGHSDDSVVYSFGGSLLTGDTLFNGTVGNCYTENYELYFESLCRVLGYPPETRIFAGHDLVDYALGVAETIEPGNGAISGYRSFCRKDFLYTTLEMEKAVNPFIRFDDPALDSYRAGLGMPLGTSYQRWRAMMSVH